MVSPCGSGFSRASFFDPKTIQATSQALDEITPIVVEKNAIPITNIEYLDSFLKDRAAKETRYVAASDEEEKHELAVNESVTPEKAVPIKQSAERRSWRLPV